MIIFGAFVRILNSGCLLQFKHKTKIAMVSICWTVGLLVFFSAYYFQETNKSLGFGICLVGTVMIGIATTLGDCTIIGFLKSVPPQLIGGWSSGTGMAGIFGTLTYLMFKTIGIEFRVVMLMFIPVAIVYYINFIVILRFKASRELIITKHAEKPIDQALIDPQVDERRQTTEIIESQENESLNLEGVKIIFKSVGVAILNLGAVS